MKSLLEGFKIACVIIGTVIGAGFISGREIISFFNSERIFVSCLLSCFLFFILSYILLSLGKKYRSVTAMNRALYKKSSKLVYGVILVSSLVTVACMLAGIDSFANIIFKIPKIYPIMSVLTLIVAFFVSKKGIKSISTASYVLIPLVVIFLVGALIIKGDFSFKAFPKSQNDGIIKPILFVTLNMFLAAPILLELGGEKNKSGFFTASLISSLTILIMILLILSSILYEGTNAVNSDLPMLFVLSGGAIRIIFAIFMYFGIFTTLMASYHPLNIFFVKHLGTGGQFTFITLAFVLSRFGVKNIVEYIYPVIGLLGLAYFISFIILELTSKIMYKLTKVGK